LVTDIGLTEDTHGHLHEVEESDQPG
jgi:hypothetical protein